MALTDRIRRTWNAFTNRDPTNDDVSNDNYNAPVYASKPDRPRLTRGNERSVITSVIVRMALDISLIDFRHCTINEEGAYQNDVPSQLSNCLNLAANIDQTYRAFIQDAVMTMMDKGCVALVPIDTEDILDPNTNEVTGFDISSMRVGEILQWKSRHIQVRVYNDIGGIKQDMWVPKDSVAIIENPLYAIMNETNSTLQRLIRKLNLLDVTDEKTASGKLDLIVQLPYTVRTETKRTQAAQRTNDIEVQLTGSKYGIAYIDGTEKVTQLNRPIENNLMSQIPYLMEQFFAQLGITQSILDGTANEETMLNYYTRTLEPIVNEIKTEMKRSFLRADAIKNGESIEAFRDPFKLLPISQVAEIADKLKRNEVLTSNELRHIIGRKPSKDSKADKLDNSNISDLKKNPSIEKNKNEEEENQNG